MWLYGLTIFLGAFLLFLVQPLLGKYVLPWFGGGPGVWTACLLFFQLVLLAGYAYAHLLTTRLRPRAQALVHVGLLGAALFFLPIIPAADWKPTGGEEPTLRILLLLSATIGLPFFVLSTTGPLLQRWWVTRQPEAAVYRLYALSNTGSLLALVGYPFVVEPLWSRSTQAWIWSGGLGVFAVLGGACAWRMSRRAMPASVSLGHSKERSGEAVKALEGSHERPAVPRDENSRNVVAWVAFPAVASLLLAATTNKLTQEVAPVPFLWVLPLAVYLVSFILCFDHPRWYRRGVFAGLLMAGCGAVLYAMKAGPDLTLKWQVVIYPAALFCACMVCHGEVYRRRPGVGQLTRFYLCLALGGVAGSVCVAVVAPAIFNDYHELPIGLCLAVLLLVPGQRRGAAIAVGIFAVALAGGFFVVTRKNLESVVISARNFYGTLQVREVEREKPAVRHWALAHGLTSHGAQFYALERARWPTTYFGHSSGVGVLFDRLKPAGAGRQVGVVGLGAGTLAVYGRSGDRFTFYEINPAMIAVARAPFTFLSGSPMPVEIVPGDARLSLEARAQRGGEENFDVLVLDAFSGDSIPVHLLTVEAWRSFLRCLKPNGVIAVHLSNRYLNLSGVAVGLSRELGLDFVIVEDKPKLKEFWITDSVWCLLTPDKQLFRRWLPPTPEARKALEDKYHPVLWTDDHASVLGVLQ